MAYKKKPISAMLDEITSGNMYLPAIQRKYVWKEEQITKLMDSIMLNYPIGTFLLWKVKKSVVNDKQYSMYKFIQDYHERDSRINPPAPQPFSAIGNYDFIWSVLDGQQRLTSLYIALQGSMSCKLPWKHSKKDDSFPKKELYFNLHSEKKTEDDEVTYEFEFLTPDTAAAQEVNKLWYKVKDIIQYKSQPEVMTKVINEKGWITDTTAMNNLLLLHERLMINELINYFEVESESIDDVLDIFVRVNSGGTVLWKSDLLFSTVVSHWDKARDEIDELLASINRIGDGYKFSNDFIMSTCLYLFDDMPVALKVETLNRERVLRIKQEWPEIKKAVTDTVELLRKFGFNSDNIVSYVAIIPIIYYHYHRGELSSDAKAELRKYLVMAQLKHIFGASSNNALTKIREVLSKEKGNPFTLKSLQGIQFTGDRNLCYTEEEIDALFDTLEIGAYTFMVLSLLYPNLKYGQNHFHQDHMHPSSGFTDKKLSDVVLSTGEHLDESIRKEWQRRRNTLANLQLLEGRENESKNDRPLKEWLQIPENAQNVKFLPSGISYELSNFEQFLEERQKLMSKELKNILL